MVMRPDDLRQGPYQFFGIGLQPEISFFCKGGRRCQSQQDMIPDNMEKEIIP
jgi:hypothetical protein